MTVTQTHLNPIRWIRTICVGIALSGALLLDGAIQCARADWNEELILSLECLVDSSDIICISRLELTDAKKREGRFHDTAAIKGAIDDATVNAELEYWKLPHSADDGDEWLLFLEKYANSTLEILHGINLTRPLQSFSTAAVTKNLIALPDKKCILRAVKSRMAEGRRLTTRDTFNWTADPHQARNDRILQEYLGCFRRPPRHTYCHYWDYPGPYDYDTGIYVVVPADPEYRDQLLAIVKNDKDEGVTTDALYALANYPGPETVAALQKYRKGEDKRAQEVLEYLSKQKY